MDSSRKYFQMSTHLPGFKSFFRLFASFCIGSITVKSLVSMERRASGFLHHFVLATVANIKIRYDAKTPQFAIFWTCIICVLYSTYNLYQIPYKLTSTSAPLVPDDLVTKLAVPRPLEGLGLKRVTLSLYLLRLKKQQQ